jgi:hypothetical protein
MNNLKDKSFNPNSVEGEINVVAMWTNPRASRIFAGVLAGFFAGTMMQIFGVIVCAIKGWDLTMPMKIPALTIIGRDALAFNSVPGIVVGLAIFYVLMGFLGAVYGHMTGTNHRGTLFGVGITWGLFGWVFITNLFLPAFHPYREADLPRQIMFFAWLVYGVSLMSISFFDRNGAKTVDEAGK